jgi:hypothetical protein
MGRHKLNPERRASGISISLSPQHKEKLKALKEFFGLRKNSDVVQRLIEREHTRSVKIKGA